MNKIEAESILVQQLLFMLTSILYSALTRMILSLK